MATIAFCNVGTRDILLDAAVLQSPVRETGQLWLGQFEALSSRLTLPIISAALDYVLLQEEKVDRFIFFGTDQQGEPYRASDTLYFAELVAKLLAQKYGERIGCTEVALIGSEPPIDPSLYDEAFSTYGDKMRRFMDREYDACYILPTGGLPACNTALILQGIGLFAARCHVVYTSGSGEPWPLQIGHQVTALMRKAAAIELLDNFDFEAAARLLSYNGHADELSLCLLAYANARLNFDFEGARDHLESAIAKSSGAIRQRLQEPRKDLQRLVNKEELARIEELYHNARIAWDNGHYVAYLGRLMRFQEAVLRHLITAMFTNSSGQLKDTFDSISVRHEIRHFLISTLEYQAEHQPPRADLYADRETLGLLLENLKTYFSLSELQDLCFDLGIDYENLDGTSKGDKARELIEYAQRTDHLVELIEACRIRRPSVQWGKEVESAIANPGNLRTACAALRRIDGLVGLRNASIIGHGFDGVSAEIILARYNSLPSEVTYHPVQDMALICGVVGVPLINPFRDVRDMIVGRLRAG
jgi:hypothetical protein